MGGVIGLLVLVKKPADIFWISYFFNDLLILGFKQLLQGCVFLVSVVSSRWVF